MARRGWARKLVVGTLAILALLCALLFRTDLEPAVVEAEYADEVSQFASLAGQRVHFKDEGQGPPILLVHGTASSLHTWDGWVRELADRHRLIRLDLPGFGLTGPATEEGNIWVVLDALLDRMQVGPVAVAGNSLGGFIAWRYALERPGRVSALILIDAAGYPRASSEGGRTLDLARVPVLGRLLTRLTPQWLVERALSEVYGDPSRLSPEVARRHYRLLRRQGNRDALFAAMNRRRSASHHERLQDIQVPALIQWGAEDRWIPPSDAQRFHDDLPDSELIVYPGVGHVPMEESPEQTARDAVSFLERRQLR